MSYVCEGPSFFFIGPFYHQEGWKVLYQVKHIVEQYWTMKNFYEIIRYKPEGGWKWAMIFMKG